MAGNDPWTHPRTSIVRKPWSGPEHDGACVRPATVELPRDGHHHVPARRQPGERFLATRFAGLGTDAPTEANGTWARNPVHSSGDQASKQIAYAAQAAVVFWAPNI